MLNLAQVWSSAIAPPDRRPAREWAHEHVELPAVLARHGKFSTADSRHFEAPLDCIDSDTNRETDVLAPPRSGKSLIADIACASLKARENAAILRVFANDKLAKAHAELRWNPIVDCCPPLVQMLPANRHEDRTLETIFSDGLPVTLTGPAISNLQQRGYKVVNLDECWEYAPGVMANARARMGDFVRDRNNKLLCISQGGEEEHDWALHFSTAVLFEWHVPCAGCGRLFIPRWTAWREDRSRWGMLFDSVRRPDGTYDEDRSLASLRVECPFCRHPHLDHEATRSAWNRGGRYLVSDPPDPQGGGAPCGREPPAEWPEHAGFHWNNLIDFPWRDLVLAWLLAQRAKRLGLFTPLVTFCQKQLAEFRSERSIFATAQPFARAPATTTDPKEKAWEGEAMRFGTFDRQSEDTYWGTIRAWDRNSGESRRLWFGRLYSDAAIAAVVAQYNVPANCVVVDSGYRAKGDQGVYALCIRYGWIAVKGDDDPFFWHTSKPQKPGEPSRRVQRPWAPVTYGDPGEGTPEQGRKRCPLIRFSSPRMKDNVQTLIKRGLWVEPEFADDHDLEREYGVQMAAEFKRMVINKTTLKREEVWTCPSGNNHAFDCAAMQVLCAMQAGLIPHGIELETAPPAASGENASPQRHEEH